MWRWLLLAWMTGCGVPEELVASDSGADDPDAGDARVEPEDGGSLGPIVTASHAGWQRPHCLSCHKGATYPHLDAGYRTPDCVACHGYNGAPHSDHAGDPAGNCRDCHSQGALVPDHLDDFELPKDCATCHVQSTARR